MAAQKGVAYYGFVSHGGGWCGRLCATIYIMVAPLSYIFALVYDFYFFRTPGQEAKDGKKFQNERHNEFMKRQILKR